MARLLQLTYFAVLAAGIILLGCTAAGLQATPIPGVTPTPELVSADTGTSGHAAHPTTPPSGAAPPSGTPHQNLPPNALDQGLTLGQLKALNEPVTCTYSWSGTTYAPPGNDILRIKGDRVKDEQVQYWSQGATQEIRDWMNGVAQTTRIRITNGSTVFSYSNPRNTGGRDCDWDPVYEPLDIMDNAWVPGDIYGYICVPDTFGDDVFSFNGTFCRPYYPTPDFPGGHP